MAFHYWNLHRNMTLFLSHHHSTSSLTSTITTTISLQEICWVVVEMIQMKVLNWVQGKLGNNIVSHKRGISVTNEIVDTRVLLDSVNLEGLDDILAIGTFGFGQLNLSNCTAEEEIADSKSLVVQCQETEAAQETNTGIGKPTTDTCIAMANEVCLIDNEMLGDQLDSDDNNAMKKKKRMTLAELFLADAPIFRNPGNVKRSSDCSDNYQERVETALTTTPPAGSAAKIQTKDGTSCSFVNKLPIPCITAGEDSYCLTYPRLPARKLHRMMAKMLKKKKKIHPAAVVQSTSETADIESDITGHNDVRTPE